VHEALAASGLAPGRLVLEVTESVLLQNSEDRRAMLHRLRALGIRIALDDFGTGYSSLSYLRSFPFDKIKIDQSFIRDLDGHPHSMVIVEAVIGLARGLGMTTVAEGVETAQQLATLTKAGCTRVQGYLFSRPVPQDEVPGLLRTLSALLPFDKAMASG
jgi:EAL domain-containing protein (putative c-di-GMP-specific phosphodiesterase class I)